MQRLYYALFLLLPVALHAQVVISGTDINQLDLDYIEVWDNFNEATKTFNAMIDYGQFDDMEQDKKGDALKVLEGKKFMSFNSSMDLLNFMYANGWEMAYVKKISRFEESYVMKKTRMNTVASVPIKFDKESLDSIQDLNEKAKEEREGEGAAQTGTKKNKATSGKKKVKKLVKKKVIRTNPEKSKKAKKKTNKEPESMDTSSYDTDMEGVHVVNKKANTTRPAATRSTATTYTTTTQPVTTSQPITTHSSANTTTHAASSNSNTYIPVGQLLTKPPTGTTSVGNTSNYRTSGYTEYAQTGTTVQPSSATTYQSTTSSSRDIVDNSNRTRKTINEVEQSLDFLIWKAKKEQEAKASKSTYDEEAYEEEWEEW